VGNRFDLTCRKYIAEHFIAMSGSGYAIGLAIAAYEWIAAVVLIFVAKFFLPVFIEKKIYTMPQFLSERYDRLKYLFGVFWIWFIFLSISLPLYIWVHCNGTDHWNTAD
jgi:SSS family solute:Na+ symporter